MTQYECENHHLNRDAKKQTHPDGSFNGYVCIECDNPASRVIE